MGTMLNNFAFGTKDAASVVLNGLMTVRNPRFVNSRLRVNKARISAPIESQRSEMGSITSPRFTGWREQQTGAATPRHRVFTLLARAGQKTKQAKPSARLKNLARFPQPDEFPGASLEAKNIRMLRHLQSGGFTKPFIIHGHPKISAGVYKFLGRAKKRRVKSGGRSRVIKAKEIRIMQAFHPRVVQPRRIDWLGLSRRTYFQHTSVSREWRRAVKRFWKPRI
jgi:hypothetical protein